MPARADRIEAEGTLAVSKATYYRVIGDEPGDIELPDPAIALPANLEEAVSTAQIHTPGVISARYTEEASRADIDTAEGALLPEVDIQATTRKDWDQSPTLPVPADNATISARLVMPLYRGGADYARTRAAKETASQRRIELREAQDQARQDVVSAWRDLMTARATITARRAQIKASEIALTGVREESNVGTRTVLDRLNAEAEAIQAQVALVQAQRDEGLAIYRVKAAVGELTAEQLKLPVEPYEPQRHYEDVENRWVGLSGGDEKAVVPVAIKPPETKLHLPKLKPIPALRK